MKVFTLGRFASLAPAALLLLLAASCGPSSADLAAAEEANADAREVDLSLFLEGAIVGEPVREYRDLGRGEPVECWVFQTRAEPAEHAMGPWAPRTVDDGPEAGGIWLEGGVVHDVDGPFVRDVGELYNDPEWNLVRPDGTVKVTDTREAFEAAARPDVDPRYHNHVVESRPEWLDPALTTWVIPVKPVARPHVTREGRARGPMGIALNGVGFDPPAPVEAILAAHTIAPFDDAGGHLNPHEGYHYHAATGHTHEVPQEDGHAPLIGYALDGFPLYAHLDAAGKPAEGLDAAGGHIDGVRGYHLHAGAAASNRVIAGFRGTPGSARRGG